MATYDVNTARKIIKNIDWPVEAELSGTDSTAEVSFEDIAVQVNSQRTEVTVHTQYAPLLSAVGNKLEDAFENSDAAAEVIPMKGRTNTFLIATVDDPPSRDGRPHRY